MSPSSSLRCAALLLVLAAAAPAAAAAPWRAQRLPDDTELIVASQPGSALSSLRFVVRAGAGRDEANKAGLAHLLEHLVFEGSHDVPGAAFVARVEGAGGRVNAFTSAQSTVYELDAPSAAFLPLARDFLKIITSPALPGGPTLARELRVIQTEDTYHPDRTGVLGLVEGALFRSVMWEASIIGTSESRARIKREDVVGFFTRHYVTSNVSLVFTGAVTEQEAQAAMAEGYRLAPALPQERVPPRFETADYPVFQQTRAALTFTAFGYPLASRDWRACRPVAELLRLRLLQAVHLRDPMVSMLDVGCVNLRGNPLLLAFAYTPSAQGSQLPSVLQEAFAALARRTASAEERRLLARRAASERALLLGSAAALAGELATAAAVPREEALTDLDFLLAPPVLAPSQLEGLVGRNFHEQRLVRISFSPFEG